MSHHDPFAPHSAAEDTAATDGADTVGREHHDHLSTMRLPDLRALAESLGLDSGGNRDKLIRRVRAHQSSSAPSDA